MNEMPVCVALIICGDIQRDPTSGALSLINCFSGLAFPDFPAPAQFRVAVMLTNIYGSVPTELRLIAPSGQEERIPGDTNPTTPSEMQNQFYDFNTFPLPEPGTYRLEFLAHGRYLIGRDFDVIRLQPDQAFPRPHSS